MDETAETVAEAWLVVVELARLSPGDISIRMFQDHPPPHLHAVKDDLQLVVDIEGLSIIAGTLPRPLQKTVMKFARDNQQELLEAWATYTKGETPDRLDR